MSTGKEKNDPAPWPAAEHFENCILELVKAKEAMTADAVNSRDPEKIKSALVKLLESNKTLIAALDKAYKRLHEARLRVGTRS